jgi:DNA-binding NarL/FixJ family response regulator
MKTGAPIRIQIADDHDVVVEGLRSLLSAEPDLEVVGPHLHSGEQLLEKIEAANPNVLLLDAKMPGFDLLTALDELSARMPKVRVIVVTARQEPQLVKAASARGAAGYILKEEALSSLLPTAIREVHKGDTWFSPRSANYLLLNMTPAHDLTAYQLEILRRMVLGESSEAIARALDKSVKAIYSAQTQIREKLAVGTNEQAIVTAIRGGLVPLDLD